MKKKILVLGMVVALVAALVVPMAALAADNEAGQGASTSYATTILIVAKTADTPITLITFPEGAASSTVSAPYNDVDGAGDPQVVGAVSEPVVRLKNTSGGTLTVTLEITAWTAAVVGEDYELVDVATTDVSVVDDVLSATGAAASVDTTISIVDGAYKALYLAVDLDSATGASGTSILTILGES